VNGATGFRPPDADIGIVLCVEQGALEGQALLLCESLRRFGGRFAGAPMYAIAPRAGYRPHRATVSALESMGVEYVDHTLNTECVEYPSANRVAAAAYVERLGRHQTLAVLDTDTLFLAEPTALALVDGVDAAVRPVDVKGMCTSGPGDAADSYWQQLCAATGVDYEALPEVTTVVDAVRVKASYNGGLVVVRTRLGILERWWELFRRSVRLGLRPLPPAGPVRASTGFVTAPAARWWGSNQAVLSLSLWSSTRAVATLPPGYNYPLHLHGAVPRATRERALADLVHVHYHFLGMADALAVNPLLNGDLPIDKVRGAWLRERLPLVPPNRRQRAARPSRQLIVTGMHRSGTSLVASTLREAGVYLGEDLLGGGVGNPRGHFEDREIVGFHDRALALAQRDFFAGGAVSPPAGSPLEAEARQIVADRSHHELWGWKDPRTSLFLDFWDHILPDARYVFVFRHPVAVALSLWRRNTDLDATQDLWVSQLDLEADPWLAIRSWETYNRLLLAFREAHPERCVVVKVPAAARDLGRLVERVEDRFGLALARGDFASLYAADDLEAIGFDDRQWLDVIPEAMALYRQLEHVADIAGEAPGGEVGARATDRERQKLQLVSAVFRGLLLRSAAGGSAGPISHQGEARFRELERRLAETQAALAQSAAVLSAIENARAFAPVRGWWSLRRRFGGRREPGSGS
jgi:hypothetical protein